MNLTTFPIRKGDMNIMGYRYETHCHTKTGFPCGRNTGDELARWFALLGYAGFFLTDHILRDEVVKLETAAAWEERVDRLCTGYDAARAEARSLGITVLQGWEYGYGWNHYLVYGLDRDWLMENRDTFCLGPVDYLKKVRQDGAVVVHAHPFREGVTSSLLIPGETDGVEVLSGMRSDEANRHADDYAASYGKFRQAGTDLHWVNHSRLCGMELDLPALSVREFFDAVRAGSARLFDIAPTVNL